MPGCVPKETSEKAGISRLKLRQPVENSRS